MRMDSVKTQPRSENYRVKKGSRSLALSGKSRSKQSRNYGQVDAGEPLSDHGVVEVRSRDDEVADSNRDQVEMQPSNYGELQDKCRGAFTNLGFCEAPHDEETQVMDALLKTVWDKSEKLEQRAGKWRDYSEELTKNKESVHENIDSRKAELLRLVEEHATSLHERTDGTLNPRLDNSKVILNDMTSVLADIQKFTDDSSKHTKAKKSSAVKRHLDKMVARIDEATVEPPPWTPLTLLATSRSIQLVSSLFGSLDIGSAGTGWFAGIGNPGGLPKVIKVKGQGEVIKVKGQGEVIKVKCQGDLEEDEGESVTSEEDGLTGLAQTEADAEVREEEMKTGLLQQPVVTKQYPSKTKKDQRPIGVMDAAVTPAGHIVIVDKHNKLVKMFDAEGVFLKFVGYKFVKVPSRVTVLRQSGQMLVTDNWSKAIKIFDKDGIYVGQFASDLEYPVAHCELYDQKLAIMNFSDCSIALYEPSGKAIHHFASGLECPAYLASTRNGNIVVTDWKNSVIKIFDITGTLVRELNAKSDKIEKPYGVCGDVHGHIMVAERSTNGIRVFSEDGEPITCFTQNDYQFKLPMAVCCNGYGALVVVEYQGLVKLLKYMDMPDVKSQIAAPKMATPLTYRPANKETTSKQAANREPVHKEPVIRLLSVDSMEDQQTQMANTTV